MSHPFPSSERRRDIAAERAVLAAVLLDPTILGPLGEIIRPGDFFVPQHSVILEAMEAVVAEGSPLDVITLSAHLRRIERLNTIGGAQYIGELTDEIPTLSHYEAHARIVADEARARELSEIVREVEARVGSGETAQELAEVLRERVASIGEPAGVHHMTPLEDAVIGVFSGLEKAIQAGVKISGTPTGFRDLDALTNGMKSGQLVVIAARPSMGKTSLAMQMALAGARSMTAPTLVFSIEMRTSALALRVLCSEGQVDSKRVESATLTQDELSRVTNAANSVFSLPVYFDDREEVDLAQLYAAVRRMHRRFGAIGRIVIDYLGLLKSGLTRALNPEQEIAIITRRLKGIAKEFDTTVVLLSQLNRKCEERPDKRPIMADLRSSGAIEQDADIVAFIYRDDYYNKNSDDRGVAEVIIAKNRNGPTDTVRLRWYPTFTAFGDLPLEQQVVTSRDDGEGLPDLDQGVFDG